MQIRIQHQDGREERITLDASQTLRFGTRRSADVVLQGAGIFPIHFGILYYRDAFTVAASKRARKIRVNGIRVRQVALHDGDRIELGKIVITVVDSEAIASQVATPARKAAKRPKQPRAKAWKDFDLPSLSTDSSAELLADLSEEVVDPLEGLSDDLLLADVPRDVVPGKRSAQRSGAPDDRTSTSAFIRLVQSPWLARVLAVCVVLPLSALIGICIGQLPTADERFRAADEAYRQEDFARAMENFDRFLSRHPRHALADEARMKRDLARLLDRFDRGTDAMTLVNETRLAAEHWQGLQLPADVQRGLAQILPPLVADLIRLAQTAAQRGASETARGARTCAGEGLQMIYNLLPAPLQRAGNVDQLQSALTRYAREVDQAAAIDATIEKINRQRDVGDLAAANEARQALLGDYPQLANNRQLVDAMRKVAMSDAVRAKLVADPTRPVAGAATDALWREIAFLAPGVAEGMPATEPHVVGVSVPESGTIYGLDAGSGQALWRHYDELCTASAVDPDSPRDYLVADDSILYVISRDQRTCLSVHYLGHEPGAVALPPVVVHDYLLVFEQTGPRHTNVHVLRRGDELQSVQTLTLPNTVTGAPVSLGEFVYLPTDRGRVRILRYQANEQDRPFSDNGELDVSDGQPWQHVELQLAIVQGKLWVGGRGVRVCEPAAAGASPKLVQRLWDDMRVTQPLRVVDGIVVGAGRTADHEGVEVRAWGLEPGKTLWSRTLAVPLQAPPLVRPKQGDVWLLSSNDTVYRVPIDRLVTESESAVAVVAWRDSIGVPSQRSAARGVSLLCGEAGVLGPTVNGDALWIVTSQGDACNAQRAALPQPLAGEPVVLGQRLLLPMHNGLLSLYDVQLRQIESSVLLPGVSPSAPPTWQTPAVIGDQEVVVTDGQAGVFLLRLRASQDGLEIVNRITVDSPFVSRLIAVSNTVWGVDGNQSLNALTVPDLTRAAGQQLSGAVVWGPQVLGAYGYLATDDGKLYCLGTATQPQWVASLACRSVVGGCLIDAQHIAIACASGIVWLLDSGTGQGSGGPLNVREPLDAGPFLIDQRLAVVTRDGCVLVTRQTVDVLMNERPAASQQIWETR